MVDTSTLRKPSATESAIFARLLEASFPGRDEIASQLSDCLVKTIDPGGSLEIEVRSGEHAPVEKTVPVEAEARDSDGITIHYLLHASEGRAIELEIYKDDLTDILVRPAPEDLEVIVLPT